jgi:hypothetical protein
MGLDSPTKRRTAGKRCAGEAKSGFVGSQHGFELFARRRTHGLGFAEQLAGLQLGSGAMLATQETRHRGGAEGTCRGEGRTRHFRAVTQTTGVDGGLGIVLGQNTLLKRKSSTTGFADKPPCGWPGLLR